ncbi:phosphate ABC transporter permease subunit PstC [Paludibacter sp. 221]|uniref:phosphate ABC transporter permease subunit PstC n=1 Tax=Paludibacter sp. 221 TaxID=2302939 RepID=UPI0013D4B41B|nr:phosphate ABC transporter permease subunit PstC [Paludibacter sp. 221]NDV46299.1 phosphate ABC transporter permease subunit PstC [Paludibacter sp. 221]
MIKQIKNNQRKHSFSSPLGRLGGAFVKFLLTASGSITSLAILLIVIFLFKEGLGLFNSPSVEKGYALCVNASNPIEELTPQQIKQIFDGEISEWRIENGELKMEDNSQFSTLHSQLIYPFRFDDVFSIYSDEEFGEDYELLPQKLGEVIAQYSNIIAFLPEQYLPRENKAVKILPVKNIRLADFFGGKEWLPTASPSPQFGVLPLIMGTMWVSFFAILIALPLGLGVAIYLSELAGTRTRNFLKPVIELLAGIPSVVYGFFGLVVLVPLIQKTLNLPVGETAFAGSLILAIMALPTIITIAEDAMRGTPRAMREASLALGATHWQTIYKVIVPYASSGIMAAVVLGIGRAIGETMAVLMVTGNAAVMPNSLFQSVRTIPATIAAELGESPAGGAHYQSLFLLGCILFVITMIISATAEFISKKKVP